MKAMTSNMASSNPSNGRTSASTIRRITRSRSTSPTDSADFNLHKYAIQNNVLQQMENRRIFPCTSDEYVIELMENKRKEERKDEIVDMLVKNFLRDETLVKSLRVNANLTDVEENELAMDEYMLMSTVVEAGTVLSAIHKETNRISGAVVIVVHDREKEKRNKSSPKPSEEKLKSRVIKDFYKYAEKIEAHYADIIFDKYPNCKHYVEIELIGVNAMDRKKGIALDLYKAVLSVIEDMPEKVSLLLGLYTSIYSVKIAEKIGKSTLSKFDVTQLKDDQGNPVFQDTVPHNIVKLMAVEI